MQERPLAAKNRLIARMIRRLRPEDIPALQEIHARTGYKGNFPDVSKMKSAHVMEEDGRIIGMAGAIPCAEICMLIDQDWGSPGRRMSLIESFHWPIAADLLTLGIHSVYVWIDPKFKSLARRLKPLGWLLQNWTCLSMTQEEIARRLNEAA